MHQGRSDIYATAIVNPINRMRPTIISAVLLEPPTPPLSESLIKLVTRDAAAEKNSTVRAM